MSPLESGTAYLCCCTTHAEKTLIAPVLYQQDHGLAAGMFSFGYGLAHPPSTLVIMWLGASGDICM